MNGLAIPRQCRWGWTISPLPIPTANPNASSTLSPPLRPLPSCHSLQRSPRLSFVSVSRSSDDARTISKLSPFPPHFSEAPSYIRRVLVHLVTSAVLLTGLRVHALDIGPSPFLPATVTIASESSSTDIPGSTYDGVDDEEFKTIFEQWKSKTFALTVPLRIVALRSSLPPSWIKDFIQVQGRRLKMIAELRESLDAIYRELSLALEKENLNPKSAMAADLVSLGDSWLGCAIQKGLIEPIPHIEERDWFQSLGNKWKAYLRRNKAGELDPCGNIWAVPYRWGTVVIAYKKSKFRRYNIPPIKDWEDLWRPELTGKISMIDSPREVIGAVLKRMGASYNTDDLDLQVIGGRECALRNLISLQKQVRFFDSMHYLKSFAAGDVWVAVGWSSDVIPSAKRMSNVAVVIPKSGSSLWADLWVVPAATKFYSDQVGGRIRGPSPLCHQWFEFCLQTSRMLPFQQEIIPGASPFALEHDLSTGQPLGLASGKPKLDTNLADGVPPPEILEKCEFLKPLSEKALEDYRWLISSMEKQRIGFLRGALNEICMRLSRSRPQPI